MITFETSPPGYLHWKLETTDEGVAFLTMDVREDAPFRPGYKLKLNSYDLGVDIELADAVQRLRFEHPEISVVVLRSAKSNIFSSGANIFMLGTSDHAFKVNFCKFTNETRLAIEDADMFSAQHYIAACNGTTAGGGYELALACNEILLVDDGNSAVSLPETSLLAVLPGTGGLTRLVDKRKVRRDRADVFCTLAEGIKGPRALEWGLVDEVIPRGSFETRVLEIARKRAARSVERKGPGIALPPLKKTVSEDRIEYRNIVLSLDRHSRTATLLVRGPGEPQPRELAEIHRAGANFWPLQTFRELDDSLLHLRFNEPETGLVILKSAGSIEHMLEVDATLEHLSHDWFVKEVLLMIKRTLKRLDLTAKSFFALIEPGSCFAGTLLELALAADRSYMLDSDGVQIAVTPLNRVAFPMSNGLSRIQNRFPGNIDRAAGLPERVFQARDAGNAGLVTFAIDEIDYEDDVRVAIEERASLSPDALTGMEANLRFAGPETMETRIFGRLSAWQNWIFSRSNATGKTGALTLYGKPERPAFDWRRT
jgi:benzoyl-CoA-dihydrodiol lyase